MRIVVAVTGASGAILAQRLLEELKKKKIERHLIISDSAELTIKHELGDVKKLEKLATKNYAFQNVGASISSSSFDVDAMVVVPCTAKTLAYIANGISDNLVVRAAENMLKMKRQLVLVVRETPFTLAMIENMKHLKAGGAVIMPPIMSYYQKPKSVDDMNNFFVGKILDILKVKHNLYRKWTGI